MPSLSLPPMHPPSSLEQTSQWTEDDMPCAPDRVEQNLRLEKLITMCPNKCPLFSLIFKKQHPRLHSMYGFHGFLTSIAHQPMKDYINYINYISIIVNISVLNPNDVCMCLVSFPCCLFICSPEQKQFLLLPL